MNSVHTICQIIKYQQCTRHLSNQQPSVVTQNVSTHFTRSSYCYLITWFETIFPEDDHVKWKEACWSNSELFIKSWCLRCWFFVTYSGMYNVIPQSCHYSCMCVCGQFFMFSSFIQYVVTSTLLFSKLIWHFLSHISAIKCLNWACQTSMSLICKESMVFYCVSLKLPILLSISFSCELLAWSYGVPSGS